MRKLIMILSVIALCGGARAVESGTRIIDADQNIYAQYASHTTGPVTMAVFAAHNVLLIDVIYLHLSAGGADTDFTVTLDNATTALIDVVLSRTGMDGETDVVFQPTRPIRLGVGDRLVFAYGNGGNKTWGIECRYSREQP